MYDNIYILQNLNRTNLSFIILSQRKHIFVKKKKLNLLIKID
jgi:hypothetical protein